MYSPGTGIFAACGFIARSSAVEIEFLTCLDLTGLIALAERFCQFTEGATKLATPLISAVVLVLAKLGKPLEPIELTAS